MVEVSNQSGARQDLISQLLGKRQQASAPKAETKTPVYEPKGREIHDTVDISGSSKIVNLSRGNDLANEIRSDSDLSTLDERLRQGTSDIERIGRLFREVFASLNTLFTRNRG